jgi:hypothetical protein
MGASLPTRIKACFNAMVLWRARVLETPFGLLLRFIYDSTSRHYNYFYNAGSSLPCWFFILVGPLIAGFLVAARIWLLWSALTLRLWSDSFDFFWRCVSDRLLWSAWRCVSDRFLWICSFDLLLWRCFSVRLPLSSSDVASLIGSFDLLLMLRFWSIPLDLLLWSASLLAPLISSDVASLIGSFDLPGFIPHRPEIGCWRPG